MKEFLVWVGNNKWCIPAAYLLIVSVWAIIVTCYDKRNAKKRPDKRVSELALFSISALGGSVAMYITMRTIRHKTSHKRFMVGIPVIIAVQVASIAVLTYLGLIKL